MAEHLDLRNAVHIGHSTGGGEVARYVAQYGQPQGRVAEAVLVNAVPPPMVKTASNPGCTPIEVFDGFRKALADNRSQFHLGVASGPFYGFNRPKAKPSTGVIYEETDIVGHVQMVGPRLIAGPRTLADHPIVGQADGFVLIADIELVADKATWRLFPAEAKIGAVADRMARKHGVILRVIGNRLALSPPLIITQAEIDELLLRLRRTLDDTATEANKRCA